MKYPFLFSLCAILLGFHNLSGQNLPSSMYFAEAEHILYTNGQPADGLYDEGNLRDFYLWFSQPNYWQTLKDNYLNKTDLPATMIVEGDTFFNVGVRFKGQTSYTQTQTSDKKSFNITMDYAVPGQNLGGYSTLNLNNAFQDPSFMREASFLHQIRRHVPAAKANFVRLFINGVNWGIYPNVQQLNGDYLKEWFFSNNGTRWRADRPIAIPGPGGGSWGDGTAALNYLGPDTSTYKQHYTLKKTEKTNPWDDLVNACQVLNTTPLANLETEVAEVLDLDRTLWFLASEIAFSDDDSYVFKGKMDYYLYWDPETERITPLEFDGNSVMKSNNVTWGVFYNENKVNYPLLNRLLAVPSIRQRYLAHFRTLVADELNSSQFNALVDQYDALISTGVTADTKKLYSNNQYNTEKQAIKNFVQNRRNNLLNNPEMSAVGPTIQNASMSSAAGNWVNPSAGQSVTVNATISAANGISKVTLFYSPAAYGNFLSTTMYDDGQHNDGAANDGVFGGQIPGFSNGTLVRFYLEAAANNTAKTVTYYPAGAEHDVFYYRVEAVLLENPSVVINEFMASNATIVTDEAGEYEDWIELHNLTDQDVNLTDYGLSDKPDNPRKWVFKPGSIIPAHGYLIVWADENGSQGPLHANFKLSAAGEWIGLTNPDGNFLDSLSFGPQITDLAYARVPNGTGPFVIQEATFAANNSPVSTSEPFGFTNQAITVFPNPAQETVRLNLHGNHIKGRVRVTDATGRLILETEALPTQTLLIPNWSPGVYYIQWGKAATKLVVF